MNQPIQTALLSTHHSEKRIPRALVARTITSVFAVLVLTYAVATQQGAISLDNFLTHGYVPYPSRFAYRSANVLTAFGAPGVVIAFGLAAAAWLWLKRRNLCGALSVLAAPGLAGVVETVGKAAVGRARPTTGALTGESGNGFPSGHAAGFAAFMLIAALVLFRPRFRVTAIVVAFGASAGMAVTRILVGAHYPTDVIAGFLIGMSIADVTYVAMPLVLERVRPLMSRVPIFAAVLARDTSLNAG